MSSSASRSFNPTIHGFRGVAALLVFIFHIYDMSRLQGLIPDDFYFPLKAAIVSLSSGVDLFFMISGYLITASLIRHANVRIFLLDRVIRIYPVFLFLHVILFTVSPFLHYKWMAGIHFGPWLLNFFSNLFLLPGVFDLPLLQLNAWSLSYEFTFYLFSAAVYLLFLRQRKAGWLLLFTAAPVFIFFYPRAAFFTVGAGIFFLLENKTFRRRMERWSIGMFCVLPFFAIVGTAYALARYKLCWFAVPFGFFIFLDVARGAKPFAKLLHHRAMQFLGTISYSFYLWHPVVTYPLKLLTAKILVGHMGMSAAWAVAIFGLASFVIVIPVSYLSYRVLEKEAGRRLRAAIGDAQRPEIVAAKI